MHLHLRFRERGDTMVEVMIAIAVVAMVLGGAYVTTNRSLQATRAAQERAVALKLAESQIERLKGLLAASPSDITSQTAVFCISYANQLATGADCRLGASGKVAAGGEVTYTLAITKPSGANDYYLVRATWADVSGRRTDDALELRYRVYG